MEAKAPEYMLNCTNVPALQGRFRLRAPDKSWYGKLKIFACDVALYPRDGQSVPILNHKVVTVRDNVGYGVERDWHAIVTSNEVITPFTVVPMRMRDLDANVFEEALGSVSLRLEQDHMDHGGGRWTLCANYCRLLEQMANAEKIGLVGTDLGQPFISVLALFAQKYLRGGIAKQVYVETRENAAYRDWVLQRPALFGVLDFITGVCLSAAEVCILACHKDTITDHTKTPAHAWDRAAMVGSEPLMQNQLLYIRLGERSDFAQRELDRIVNTFRVLHANFIRNKGEGCLADVWLANVRFTFICVSPVPQPQDGMVLDMLTSWKDMMTGQQRGLPEDGRYLAPQTDHAANDLKKYLSAASADPSVFASSYLTETDIRSLDPNEELGAQFLGE